MVCWHLIVCWHFMTLAFHGAMVFHDIDISSASVGVSVGVCWSVCRVYMFGLSVLCVFWCVG